MKKIVFQILLATQTPQTIAEVTVASAAEARAAGRRMYADALRSKERLEAKRQEQQDLEALEDLNQRVSWLKKPGWLPWDDSLYIRGKKPEYIIYFQHENPAVGW